MRTGQTFQKAIVHHKAGEIEDAERLYRSILNQEPRHTDANYRLGILLKQGGQADSALPFFKAALESNPNKAQYWLGYIETLIILEKYAAARSVLEQGQLKGLKGREVDNLVRQVNLPTDTVPVLPTVSKTLNIDRLLSRAKSNIKKGEIHAARELYNQVLGAYPDNQPAKKGIKAIEKGDKAKKNPLGSSQTENDSVTALYTQGQIQETLNELKVLIKKNPNESLLYNMSGECYKLLGQLDTAVKYYQQALVIEPDNATTHNNLANLFKKLGQLKTAMKHYDQAIKIKPDYAEANNNFGNTLQLLGDPKAAVKYFKRAVAIKPKYAEAYFNLANTLNEIGQLEQAVKHYEQALALDPRFVQAHSNLGVTLNDLGQFDVAVKRFEQVLALEPSIAEAHNNLGLALQELGQLDAAVDSYEQALIIKPDYAQAWRNLYFTVQPLTSLEKSKGTWLRSFKNRLSSENLSGINFALLDYQLNSFKPQTVAESYGVAKNALPSIANEEIINPEKVRQLTGEKVVPEQLIALFHFGRSGTGLLHSLIDNHSEISTLPSIYFSEYFNDDIWAKLIAQGWDQMPDNFIKQFAVLFDARSSVPVPSIDKPIAHLGQKEGMVNVGVNRDEVLTVDQNHFAVELRQLMAGRSSLTSQSFFSLLHKAYEKTLNKSSNKHTIFYHIHNPTVYAQLNFLRYNPDARIMMMIRDPIQSCESWVEKAFNSGYKQSGSAHNRIVRMLFDIDQVAFRYQDAIGVRLEDLKKHPKKTVTAMCDWMGIEEEASLFEMTAQGKKWWGDPSSPDYSPKGMTPFDNAAITRKVGSIFNEQDQFILRTLFYPFSVRFGYVAENITEFKEDLKAIKPLLDQPFGFQEKLAENLSQDLDTITRSGSALYLRAALHDRWAVLDEFNDYPHMLKPLVLQES